MDTAGWIYCHSVSKRVTMQTIADACGVSRNAVSIAMRGGGKGVSTATADRIRAKAEELGYIPDPELSRLARKLGSSRKHEGVRAEIPFVVPIPEGCPDDGSHFFMDMCRPFALKQGYKVTPYFTGLNHYSVARVQQIWESRGVKGVLLFNPFDTEWDHTEQFEWDRFSWIIFSESVHDPLLHRMNWDFRSALDTCFFQLQQKGYQRVGMVLQKRYDELVGHAGLAADAIHRDRTPTKDQVSWLRHLGLIGAEEGRNALRAWLKKEKPDAVIGHGACKDVIQQLGYRIPEDIGFADWRLDQDMVGEVAGILPSFASMGRIAVDLLLSQVEHQITGIPEHPVLTLIEGHWVEGQTTVS